MHQYEAPAIQKGHENFPRRERRSRSAPLAAAVLAGLGLNAAHAAESASRTYKIDPQPIATALKAFAAQSDMQLIFTQRDVGHAETAGVSGKLAPNDALRQILKGTDLQFELTANEVIVVRKSSSLQRASATAFLNGHDGLRAISRIEREQSMGSAGTGRAWRRLALAQAENDTSSARQDRPSAAIEARSGARSARQSEFLEEIVVTAQKREESLTDVPISITAITVEELESLRVQGLDDILLNIPNLTTLNKGSWWGYDISLRGISDFSGGRYDVVSVMLDDVGYALNDSDDILTTRFLDIERIEVLRGPQGVLSGRNSVSGSINVITAKPNPDAFELKTTLDIGRFETYLAKAVLNMPVNDQLAFRTLVYGEQSEGAIENIGPSGGSSSKDHYGGRVAMRWFVNDALTIDASFGYEELDFGLENQIISDQWLSDEDRQAAIEEITLWGGQFAGVVDWFQDVGTNGGKVSFDVDPFTRHENEIASLRASYELGTNTIDLIAGHYDNEAANAVDNDMTEYANGRLVGYRKLNTDSVELRVTSDNEGPLNWVGGISYIEQDLRFRITDDYDVYAFDAEPTDTNFYPGLIPRLGAPGRTPFYVFDYLSQDLAKNTGIFANLFWDITDRWHLSAGGRYSRDEIRFGEAFVFEDVGRPDLVQPPLTDADFAIDATTSQFSPRLALNFDISEDVSVYTQVSEGYRAGYGNVLTAVEAGAPEDVEPEQIRNYELGLKGRFLDERLVLSTAVYYMDYTDLQVTQELEQDLFPFEVFFDTNAGSAHAQGFELEGAAQITERFVLQGGLGYADATIDEVTLDGEEIRNIDLPGVRDWTVNLAGIYTRPINSALEGQLRVDYNYQGDVYTEGVLPDPIFYNPSYQTVDLSLSVSGERWDATAYFDNVLDEEYFLSVQFEETAGGTFRGRRGPVVYIVPRMYGLRFNYRFGG